MPLMTKVEVVIRHPWYNSISAPKYDTTALTVAAEANYYQRTENRARLERSK